MTTTIERRVAQLEATTDGGDRCPECGGHDRDGDTYEILFVDPDDATPDEWCGTCGCALSITIHMDWGGSTA